MIIGGINMAKMRGKSLIVTALAAGAASYLSKKENRDKALSLFKELQGKASNKIKQQPSEEYQSRYNNLEEIAETAAGSDETKIRENNMIAESGLQTAVLYYNENNQELH